MIQRPLSELERNVTLFGKNVVTIPKLKPIFSVRDGQPQKSNLEGKRIFPHYEEKCI